MKKCLYVIKGTRGIADAITPLADVRRKGSYCATADSSPTVE